MLAGCSHSLDVTRGKRKRKKGNKWNKIDKNRPQERCEDHWQFAIGRYCLETRERVGVCKITYVNLPLLHIDKCVNNLLWAVWVCWGKEKATLTNISVSVLLSWIKWSPVMLPLPGCSFPKPAPMHVTATSLCKCGQQQLPGILLTALPSFLTEDPRATWHRFLLFFSHSSWKPRSF